MDEQEFTEWASGCQRSLLRTAYLLTGDLHRSQDLVQEALVKVALRWSRLRDGNPTAYARRIVVHDNVNWWLRRRESTGADPDHSVPDEVSSDPVSALVVRRALMRLTPAQRAVLVLRHLDDLSERETAEALGVSVGTAKSQNAAALARLRTGAGRSWGISVVVADRETLTPRFRLPVVDHEANYSNWGLGTVAVADNGTVLMQVAAIGRQVEGFRLVAWDPVSGELSIVSSTALPVESSVVIAPAMLRAIGPG